ncbi:MAG: hypothetical protein AB1611_08595 [bacterium]
MDCRGVVITGMKAALITFLFLSGCRSDSSGDNKQITPYAANKAAPLSGIRVSGTLDIDFSASSPRVRMKGPTNPGPDGTSGPPDDVPGAGGGPQSGSGSGTGNGPPDGTPGPPDDTTGSQSGTTGGGPPTGTPGPQNAGQGAGRGGGTMNAVISQYAVVMILGNTGLYGVPDAEGSFQILDCQAGNYSLTLYYDGNQVAKKDIRLSLPYDLDLGRISGIDADGLLICDGFDGYRFPWKDEDGDGVNDLFQDTDGDGKNDLTGQAYAHGYGWQDENADGINDSFIDADGDGRNDLLPQSSPYGFTFGFVDKNNDGLNDFFQDANGDGINDLNNHVLYSHLYGWQDEDEDGINDKFADANGDGINDLTGRPAIHGYRFKFIDQNGDGTNDIFTDADGNGICDPGKPAEGMSYAHGYGWQDEDRNGINDNFIDANGDGINDLTGIRY